MHRKKMLHDLFSYTYSLISLEISACIGTFSPVSQPLTNVNMAFWCWTSSWLSNDLMEREAIFLQRAESSLTIAKDRGTKKSPQCSKRKGYRSKQASIKIHSYISHRLNKKNKYSVVQGVSWYPRECLEDEGHHLKSRLSPGVILVSA